MWPPRNTSYIQWVPGVHSWVDIARGALGLGAGNRPMGRRAAYLDLLAPFETITMRTSMSIMSGCALTIRGLWRCYGIDAHELTEPYHIGHAVVDVVNIARRFGAWRGHDTLPDVGDVVLVGSTSPGWGGTEHVFTITDIQSGQVKSVDGGQNDSMGQCIIERSRVLRSVGSTLWLSSRRIAGVVRMAKMPSTLPMFFPIHN